MTKNLPCALTIAGSDSGGGAGIQADLKTFTAIGVHGATAITCITAQNPVEVRSLQPIRPEIVKDQLAAVIDQLQPQAVKTGMLYSAAIIEIVREMLEDYLKPVVDPVMISTSGALLLRSNAIKAMKALIRESLLVTPNLHEAEHLLGRPLKTPEDLRSAAREFHETFGCAALIKGGHLSGLDVSIDFYFDGKTEWLLEAPYIRGISTHGTGCTYSAAITAYLALGRLLPEAVANAKEFISNSIASSYKTHRHFVLNTSWRNK